MCFGRFLSHSFCLCILPRSKTISYVNECKINIYNWYIIWRELSKVPVCVCVGIVITSAKHLHNSLHISILAPSTDDQPTWQNIHKEQKHEYQNHYYLWLKSKQVLWRRHDDAKFVFVCYKRGNKTLNNGTLLGSAVNVHILYTIPHFYCFPANAFCFLCTYRSNNTLS